MDVEDPNAPDFWRALCPELTVSDGGPVVRNIAGTTFVSPDVATLQKRLGAHGYFTVQPPLPPVASDRDAGPADSVVSETLERLARAVLKLKEAGWPSTFLLVYDEVWEVQRELVTPLMTAVTGNLPNFDTLAIMVDPKHGGAGFTPHRDRQPPNVAASFRPDGSPKYSTAWLALRDVTPENSCMYFIPREADPGYIAGDGTGPNDDMLRDALSTKARYQDIRAVPLQAGGATFFTHRLIHWGSRALDTCCDPRIAITFAYSDPSFEAPALEGADATSPEFVLRLGLAAGQMLIYHERFEPTLERLAVYNEMFKAVSERFSQPYRRKVNLDFVASVKDAEARAEHHHAESSSLHMDEGHDLIDVAADAMLDAVLEGYGEFEDDYDDEHTGGLSHDEENFPAEETATVDTTTLSNPPNKKRRVEETALCE